MVIYVLYCWDSVLRRIWSQAGMIGEERRVGGRVCVTLSTKFGLCPSGPSPTVKIRYWTIRARAWRFTSLVGNLLNPCNYCARTTPIHLHRTFDRDASLYPSATRIENLLKEAPATLRRCWRPTMTRKTWSTIIQRPRSQSASGHGIFSKRLQRFDSLTRLSKFR